MKIELDPRAEEMIRTAMGQEPGLMRLVYDTEDCGCGMSGVPGLQIAGEPGAYDIPLENETFPFWIDRMQAIFLKNNWFLPVRKAAERFAWMACHSFISRISD